MKGKFRSFRVLSLITAVALLVTLLTVRSGQAADNPPANLPTYKLNLGTMFYDPAGSPDFNSDGRYVTHFVNRVKELSGGRIAVTVHWGSVLGPTEALIDQLKSGSLELVAGSIYTSTDKRFGVFYMPNMYDDFNMVQKLIVDQGAPLRVLMEKIYTENNLVLLTPTVGAFRGIFNNKREIHLPTDVSGLRMRTYADAVVNTYWSSLCSTANIAMAELYTALQLGTVDGFEILPPAMIANGLTDVLKFYTNIDWQWMANTNLSMSKKTYDKMVPEAQQILKQAAAEAAVVYRELVEKYYAEADAYMTSHGIKVYHLTNDERAQWVKYGRGLWPQFRDKFGPETYDQVVSILQNYKK